MAAGIRLVLVSILFVGSLHAIPGRLSGMWICFSRLVLLCATKWSIVGMCNAVRSGFDGSSMISAGGSALCYRYASRTNQSLVIRR